MTEPLPPSAVPHPISALAPPATLDQVISELTAIVASSIVASSRIGYFAALYRRVTQTVRDQLAHFDDPARMERFDVVFAGRYLDALRTFREGGRPSASWRVAFSAAAESSPIALQHLILGMNAHINLDLGIAAARIAPGAALPGLKADFLRINALLGSLVPQVIEQVGTISPLIGLVTQVLGPTEDDRIANFSLTAARDWAWHVAKTLAPLDPARQAPVIDLLDRTTAVLGRQLRHPDPVLAALYRVIRSRETDSVAEVIEVLAAP
jgi:hypothetical protein